MVKWLKGGKNYKNNKNRYFRAQQSGYNVTPALAEYGIAKKFMEGREAVEEYYVPLETDFPRELTALDIIKCVLGLIFFVAVCYYGGTQYGR